MKWVDIMSTHFTILKYERIRRENAPFLFFIFRRISSKFYFCQIFYHAKLLPHYYAKLLPLYHTKSLKSNFLTPKSYSAPATVKFYTVSNFERANKLQLISWKLGVKLSFRIIKFENFLILRYNIYRKSRKTKKNKTLLSWE